MSNIPWNPYGNRSGNNISSTTNNEAGNFNQNSANHFLIQKQQQNLEMMFDFTKKNNNKRSFDEQVNSKFILNNYNNDDHINNSTQVTQYINVNDIQMAPAKIKRRRMKVISSPYHEKTSAILIQGQRKYFQRYSKEISDFVYEEDYDDEDLEIDIEQEEEIRKMNMNYHQKPFWPVSAARKRSSSVPVSASTDIKMNENNGNNSDSSSGGNSIDSVNLGNGYCISKVVSHTDISTRRQFIEKLRCQVCNELISHPSRQNSRICNGDFDIEEHSCCRCKKILCGLCCFNGDYGPVSCFNCRYE